MDCMHVAKLNNFVVNVLCTSLRFQVVQVKSQYIAKVMVSEEES